MLYIADVLAQLSYNIYPNIVFGRSLFLKRSFADHNKLIILIKISWQSLPIETNLAGLTELLITCNTKTMYALTVTRSNQYG